MARNSRTGSTCRMRDGLELAARLLHLCEPRWRWQADCLQIKFGFGVQGQIVVWRICNSKPEL